MNLEATYQFVFDALVQDTRNAIHRIADDDLPAETAKSGRSRTLPLTAEALAAIQRQSKRSMFVWSHEDGQPLKDVRGSLERACQLAGLDRITPHVLRHTCASWQVQAGVPLYSVQRWLGHSTIKMTERYAHLAPEHLQEGAAALAGWPVNHRA